MVDVDLINTLPSPERQAWHNLALMLAGRLQPVPETEEPTEPECPHCTFGYVKKAPEAHPGDPLFGAIRPCPVCREPGIEQRAIERILKSSGILGDQAGYTFESYKDVPGADLEASAIVEEWTEDEPPKGSIFLYGETGKGKTGLGIAALNRLNGRRARSTTFITEPDLFMELQATNAGDAEASEVDIIGRLTTNSEVVMIDDLGAGRWTGYREEKLYQIISRRNAAGQNTIITSNIRTLEALEERVNGRTYWRILEMCRGNILNMEGENLRDPRRLVHYR
jgi:DNA replication protein DnaC